MKKIFCFATLLLVAGGAHAEGIPQLNVDCPGNLAVSAEQGGPVLINGKEAKTKTINERFFEAKAADTTLSISVADDDSVTVTYTGKHGANGVCTSVDD